MGEANVDAMLRRLSARQLSEWYAFYQMEPFGELQHELRTARLSTLLAQPHRNKDKHPEPFSVQEFVAAPFDRDVAEAITSSGHDRIARGMDDLASIMGTA